MKNQWALTETCINGSIWYYRITWQRRRTIILRKNPKGYIVMGEQVLQAPQKLVPRVLVDRVLLVTIQIPIQQLVLTRIGRIDAAAFFF